MTHSIYSGFVWHKRELPKVHEFKYPVYYWAVDIDEPDSINKSWPICGYDRFSIFSVKSSTLLEPGPQPIREKLNKFFDVPPNKVILLTTPKLFGYAFNPLSIYICYANEKISSLLLEVSNTFGESHAYVLKGGSTGSSFIASEFNKEFFVSPFFDISGQYKVALQSFGETLDLVVELYKNGERHFIAKLSGNRNSFSRATIFNSLLRAPLTGWATMLRIQGQAVVMFFKRKLPFVRKQETVTGLKIKNSPTVFDKARNWIVNKFAA